MKILKYLFLSIALFSFVACSGPVDGDDPVEDKNGEEAMEPEKENKPLIGNDLEYAFEGMLEDVTEGKAFGTAKSNFAEDRYDLVATFANLPEPQGSDFYEGWIVRKGENFDVVSTGKAKKIEGVYTNVFTSDEDLTDHDFYVLTVEPDDGDPAPADHVLEGTMTAKG